MSTGDTDLILGLSLGLSKTAWDDLAHLATHRQKLSEVTDATSRLAPGIRLSDAARTVGEAAGLSPQDANRILWTIQNLQRLKIRLRQDTAELLRTLTATLESQAPEGWKKAHLEGWREASGLIRGLLDIVRDDHPLTVLRKAEQLGAEHQNSFMDARILTDLRPVFSAAGDTIHESLIIQTLLIDYHDGTERRRVALALDARDIAQIRRLCERAEVKASALKAAVSPLKWPAVILGEEETS
jgi:hypothetical protein